MKDKQKITTACFRLLEGPRLSVKKSLRAGEWIRGALMAQAKKRFGADSIPWEISGHNLPKNNNHSHFFYLPEDSLGNGFIDSFFVYCGGGFGPKPIQALKRLNYLQNDKGERWSLVLENFGSTENFKNGSSLFGKSNLWQSRSPYFHPWHRKKRFTLFDQLKKECGVRGWPDLKDIQLIPYLSRGERRLYPFSFHKFRSKKNLSQPDKNGGFWRLNFKNPVQGPVSLGFGCHFGLGLFGALKEAGEETGKIKDKAS